MSILSEEDIEKLKETHPFKRILRILFLIIGIFIIFVGFMFFLIGFDFGILIEDINISFIIDFIIIILGMIITSKFFIAPYYLRENSLTVKKIRDLREPVEKYIKFNSIAITRLIAAILLIVVGSITLLFFGLEVGHEVPYGSAVVLGGPSFFYVTGLPALGIGLGLMIYFILSPFRGIFSQSRNFYFFYELRPFCPWLTEIPKKDIEAIRYQNNHLGPKLGWIMLILPFIVLQLMTAIPLFMAERAGPDYVLSWIFLIISILEIFVLILLVLFQQNYFEIATRTHLYEMWFSPIKLKQKSELTEDLSNFLECEIERDFKGDPNTQSIFSELDNAHFQLFNMIFGLFLIISGIVMATNMVLFGPLFWWVAIMYGFMLIVKAYSFDFSKRGEDKFYYNKENSIFKFRRRFGKKFHYISARNIESVKIRKWFRKLDFFDIFGLGAMMVMLTIQQIEGWVIVDTIPTIIHNIISTIYMGIIFIFIILYVCLPIDVIEFKTPSLIYRIQITLKLKDKNLIQKYYNNLKEFFKEVLKGDLIRTFKLRIGVILVLIIGSVFYSIYIIISFFV